MADVPIPVRQCLLPGLDTSILFPDVSVSYFSIKTKLVQSYAGVSLVGRNARPSSITRVSRKLLSVAASPIS